MRIPTGDTGGGGSGGGGAVAGGGIRGPGAGGIGPRRHPSPPRHNPIPGYGFEREPGKGETRVPISNNLIGPGKLFTNRVAARAFTTYDGWRIPGRWLYQNYPGADMLVRAQINLRAGRVQVTPGFSLPHNVELARKELKRILG